MATSAFRSTTRRTSIGGSPADDSSSSSSSNRTSAHRRSRSLSRVSRRVPEPDVDFSDGAPAPRGRFVNTVRGSGFPEISLDDLAINFFSSGDRGRSAQRNADVSPGNAETASQRRGRSVSRQSSGGVDRRSSLCYTPGPGGGRIASASENHSRRRRSLSVVRCPISDSESDLYHSHNTSDNTNAKHFHSRSNQRLLSRKPAATPQRQGLRRSSSQKDFKSSDCDSSQSSALTDDEVKDNHSAKGGNERTIRAVYAQRKTEHPTGDDMNGGLYEAMRKELRHAIRMEIGHVMSKGASDPGTCDGFPLKDSDVLRAVSTIQRNYSNKLEQSELRKQDLMAEIVMEEQRGKVFPEPNGGVTAKPSQTRRSNDRSRVSKKLSEEAEKYIEDFIMNVEDTDISSIDGERSDTSSSLGVILKADIFQSPTPTKPLPVEMDGVKLPWLEWETSHDVSPQLSCVKLDSPATPVSSMRRNGQEAINGQDQSGYSASSHGSWNPESLCAPLMAFREQKLLPEQSPKTSSVDLDEYMKSINDEDFLYERWSQKQRISTGGMLVCNHHTFF